MDAKMLLRALPILIIGSPLWLYTLFTIAWLRLLKPDALKDVRGNERAKTGVQHPPVKGVTHEQIASNGCSIHVARAGVSSSKQLVLFLHGFPECWYSWREQLVDLQGEFEVAAIDLPGYNASSGPTQRAGYLSYNLCAIIAGVLRGLGRESCTLVGHDWGAAIAYDFAALYPEKVARLMILSVPPLQCFARNMDIGQAVTSSYMQQFVLPALPEMLLRRNDYAMFRTILTKPAAGGVVNNTVTDKDVQIYKDAIATPGALTRALNYYRASLLDDNILRRNKDLHRRRRVPLSMPATLMVGDRDKFLHVKLFSHVGTYAPHATVHIVPNCSHWVQQDVPGKVNKALRELANA